MDGPPWRAGRAVGLLCILGPLDGFAAARKGGGIMQRLLVAWLVSAAFLAASGQPAPTPRSTSPAPPAPAAPSAPAGSGAGAGRRGTRQRSGAARGAWQGHTQPHG